MQDRCKLLDFCNWLEYFKGQIIAECTSVILSMETVRVHTLIIIKSGILKSIFFIIYRQNCTKFYGVCCPSHSLFGFVYVLFWALVLK